MDCSTAHNTNKSWRFSCVSGHCKAMELHVIAKKGLFFMLKFRHKIKKTTGAAFTIVLSLKITDRPTKLECLSVAGLSRLVLCLWFWTGGSI